jgi:uncharacterized protein (TIGR03437 family)
MILRDPALAARIHSRQELRPAVNDSRGRTLEAVQAAARAAAVREHAEVLHSTKILLNAVYIRATEQQAEALRSTPGVVAVVKIPAMRRHQSPELDLIHAPAAWNRVGGARNAGAGSGIAIIDTGIDVTHLELNDTGFTAPAGYPLCSTPADCAYTNKKVIVARSYVPRLAAGNGTAADSRPDDLSPRDRVGHGTAVAALAGGHYGVAPGAYLGNYKVFGSPGVNDVAFADVVVRALEDALMDGMTVAVLSLGHPGTWYYTDQVCGSQGDQVCDVWAQAVENAANNGLTVVASAGNEGEASAFGIFPNLNSIDSPGTAPGAITVGATTNSRAFFSTASIQGSSLPPEVAAMYTLFSDAPRPASAIAAPVRDTAAIGNDGKACSPLPGNSLSGAFALISIGNPSDCMLVSKVDNARNAGAAGVVFYRAQKDDSVVSLTGLTMTGIPSILIGNTAGTALQQYLATNHDPQLTMDPSLVEVSGYAADEIAIFSSEGPNIGDYAIKPEVVAPGTGLFVATQSFDPNGDMWNPTGHSTVQGTSFPAAMVAGAVAIAHQRFPHASPAQLKSMVVNTANPDNVYDYDSSNNRIPASVTGMGAGKLDLDYASLTTVTAEPATISFGVADPLPAAAVILTLTNHGNAPVSLQLSVKPGQADARAAVQLSQNSLQLQPGGAQQITVRLAGSPPASGAYEGAIVVSGGPVPIRVPYFYVATDYTLNNIYQITGYWELDPSLPAGLLPELDFKATDRFGVPLSGVDYAWTPRTAINMAGLTSDGYGIGYAVLNSFTSPGPQAVMLNVGGAEIPFTGLVRPAPVIGAGRVNNAASGDTGRGLAPGSYIAIYGSGLSPATQVYSTTYLPISLAGVSVSFDTADGRVSVPAHIHFVSDGQINVQIPWELQGYPSALMKVSIGLTQTDLYTVQLTQYSPGFFENPYDRSGPMAWAIDYPAEAGKPTFLVSSDQPASRGDTLQFYVNGLGPVDHPTSSGEPAPSEPLSNTIGSPSVTIGGKTASVSFSGLTPTLVGLYAVNVIVPPDAPSGVQPLVISMGAVDSLPSRIAIR